MDFIDDRKKKNRRIKFSPELCIQNFCGSGTEQLTCQNMMQGKIKYKVNAFYIQQKKIVKIIESSE